jgi:PIN domain nuclease of toxin-antitoxin system
VDTGHDRLGPQARSSIVERESDFEPLSITFQHAFAVRTLPLHHGDPFDRMLVAQAQCEGLTIVTVDPVIRSYDVPALNAAI